jgi:hypothetical protein
MSECAKELFKEVLCVKKNNTTEAKNACCLFFADANGMGLCDNTNTTTIQKLCN